MTTTQQNGSTSTQGKTNHETPIISADVMTAFGSVREHQDREKAVREAKRRETEEFNRSRLKEYKLADALREVEENQISADLDAAIKIAGHSHALLGLVFTLKSSTDESALGNQRPSSAEMAQSLGLPLPELSENQEKMSSRTARFFLLVVGVLVGTSYGILSHSLQVSNLLAHILTLVFWCVCGYVIVWWLKKGITASTTQASDIYWSARADYAFSFYFQKDKPGGFAQSLPSVLLIQSGKTGKIWIGASLVIALCILLGESWLECRGLLAPVFARQALQAMRGGTVPSLSPFDYIGFCTMALLPTIGMVVFAWQEGWYAGQWRACNARIEAGCDREHRSRVETRRMLPAVISASAAVADVRHLQHKLQQIEANRAALHQAYLGSLKEVAS